MNRPMFGYMFLLRVPLAAALFAAAFRWLALSSGFAPYLRGLYDTGADSTFWVTLAAGLYWLAMTITSSVILRHGADRALLRPLPDWATHPIGLGVTRVTAILGLTYAVAVGLLLSGFTAGRPGAGLAIAGGVAVFALGLALFAWLFERLRRHFPTKPPLISRLMRRLHSPAGFFDSAGQPLPGHRFSQNAFFCFLAIYAWFGWTTWSMIERPHQLGPTVFLCLLFLVTLACWTLAGVSFIVDRWRLPVLVLLSLVWAAGSGLLGGSWFQRTDHIFTSRPLAENVSLLRPADLLRPRENRVVLVAISGGGGFSAGWSTQVLGGLSSDIPAFSPTIRLVSAVSGGSVGAMYFLNEFRGGVFDPAQARPVFDRATRPSLAHLAWGLAYPDLLRMFFPGVPQEVDRSWALERAWIRDAGSLRDATLAQWARDPLTRPAVSLNATVVEAGERFLFSTYRPDPEDDPLHASRLFWDEFPRQDIPISTAARLSAAFPYLSPVSRSGTATDPHRAYHLGDGGYFDNFGVVSALEFLRGALRHTVQRPQVLLIQIELGPTWNSTSQTFAQRGWGYQLIAPPAGYLGVWNTTARDRNAVDLALLQQIYPGLITTVRFGFPQWDTATTWHLTSGDVESIQRAWKSDATVQQARRQVEAFFAEANRK